MVLFVCPDGRVCPKSSAGHFATSLLFWLSCAWRVSHLQSLVLSSWHRLPVGLEDVSKYPDLIAELLRRKWTETEVKGVLAHNLLRVFSEVELVRRECHLGSPPFPSPKAGCLTCVCLQISNNMQGPEEEPISLAKLDGACRTPYGYSQAPSVHFQRGALLASLAPLLFSLHLL